MGISTKKPNSKDILGEFQTSKGYLVVQEWTAPDAPSATAVLAATDLTDAVQAITADITNPDFPRNVTVKGNASGITGNVVITGTNIRDEVITETIALSGASEVQGNKAFKTVTSVSLPIETHAGTDTVSVGIGSKLGLFRKMKGDQVVLVTATGTYETTRPTVAASVTLIESNTMLPNTAPNATLNFLCAFVTQELTQTGHTTS